LDLHDASGQLISQNFYWLGLESSSYRELARLPPADISAVAESTRNGETIRIRVQLQDTGTTAALQNKLTLLSARDGTRILPAYLGDNYVSLLPGEKAEIQIEYPSSAGAGAAQLAIRGWNLAPRTISVLDSKGENSA
jgi:Exo-beta-D-glucosaminidase Ig-fold domain